MMGMMMPRRFMRIRVAAAPSVAVLIALATQASAADAEHGKALFAPHGDQKSDPSVLELIRRRAEVRTAPKTYRSK